jgi:uncharacterized membrane protein YjdF
MKVGLRLFVSSGVFAIVIAVAYWLLAREPAGTMLLGFLAFALSFIAGYMIVAEREADLCGDDAKADNTGSAGEIVGSYTIRSPLPIASAAAVTCVGFGLVVSPTIAALGIIAIFALGALFIVQSS